MTTKFNKKSLSELTSWLNKYHKEMKAIKSTNQILKSVKISKPLPGVLLLIFPTRRLLCETFCRIQEHYESPEFSGKIFSLKEYKDWYIKTTGGWTYYNDWSGFNVPSQSFDAFRDGKFDPLTPKELWLLNLKKSSRAKYVIATYEKSPADVVPHEISHALFRVNQSYKKEILKELSRHNLTSVKKYLKKTGYNESVWDDECHAYIGESSMDLDANRVKYPKELTKKLLEIKAKYLNNWSKS